MYASYWYNAGATAGNVLSDVVALLAGETTVNNLSTSCNKTNTTITASVRAAGWSVHDASAGTNAQVLKAAIADNESQFKYLRLSTNASGYLIASLYEDWDADAHSGTNMAYSSETSGSLQQVNLDTGGRIEISSSARHACFFGKTFGGSWGSNSLYPTCIFERTRLSVWDTASAGYLPAIFTNGPISTGYECRRLNSDTGLNITSNNAIVNIFTTLPSTGVSIIVNDIAILNGNAQPVYPAVPFGYGKEDEWHLGGWVSSLADMFLLQRYSVCNGDVFYINNNEYVVWSYGTSYLAGTVAVRKG